MADEGVAMAQDGPELEEEQGVAVAFLTVNEDKKGVVGAYKVRDGDEHSLDDEPEETEGLV